MSVLSLTVSKDGTTKRIEVPVFCLRGAYRGRYEIWALEAPRSKNRIHLGWVLRDAGCGWKAYGPPLTHRVDESDGPGQPLVPLGEIERPSPGSDVVSW